MQTQTKWAFTVVVVTFNAQKAFCSDFLFPFDRASSCVHFSTFAITSFPCSCLAFMSPLYSYMLEWGLYVGTAVSTAIFTLVSWKQFGFCALFNTAAGWAPACKQQEILMRIVGITVLTQHKATSFKNVLVLSDGTWRSSMCGGWRRLLSAAEGGADTMHPVLNSSRS